MWPLDRFGYLLDIFLDRHPEFIVFIISKDQLQIDTGRKSGRIISLYGLPLSSCLSFVSQADLFLGIYSCMLHAADLFNIPGVGLFGPTKYTEFGFRFSRHRYVYGNGNMNQIRIDEVDTALESLLADIAMR
jgi:ADP-heptose:LPS heptosyltransferase